MKKLIAFCLLFLISGASFAQKCKEVVDPITNEKKYMFENVGGTVYHYLKYEVINGKTTLYKQFYYNGAMNVQAPAGMEIFFKLENGDIVKLKTLSDAAGKMYPSPYGITTGYNFTMNVSKEDLNKLAASPVVLIRIPKITEEGFYDIDKKNLMVKKSSKPMMKGAACISGYAQ